VIRRRLEIPLGIGESLHRFLKGSLGRLEFGDGAVAFGLRKRIYAAGGKEQNRGEK
jgi:hypothetical protein